jgi:hypothetical protein
MRKCEKGRVDLSEFLYKVGAVQGQPHTILWNPQSFPGDSVNFIIWESSETLTVKNNGRYIFKNMYAGGWTSFIINGCDSGVWNCSYVYEVPHMTTAPSSSSDRITYPKRGDTLHIGTRQYVTWDRMLFGGSVMIWLCDSTKKRDFARQVSDKTPNTGELAWPVPNISPGIYCFEFEDWADTIIVYGMPFFIAP